MSKKLSRPDFFTLDWIIEQKKLGKTDKELRNELFVSDNVFRRWKTEVAYVSIKGRPNTVPYKELKRLRLTGHTYEWIENHLKISHASVVNGIKMMKEGKI